MRRSYVTTALALLLIAVFVACGLMLPSLFLHWEQQKLTGGTVTVQKADVSPYELAEIDAVRIGQLSAVLSESDVLRGTFGPQFGEREPLTGELSAADADAVGRSFLSIVSEAASFYDSGDWDWRIDDAVLYAFQEDPSLSFWHLTYQGFKNGDKMLSFTLLLDSVSGLPLSSVLEGGNLPAEETMLVDMVFVPIISLYASRFDLRFGPINVEEATDAASGVWTVEDDTPRAVKDVSSDAVVSFYGDSLRSMYDRRYFVSGDAYQLECELFVSETGNLIFLTGLNKIQVVS